MTDEPSAFPVVEVFVNIVAVVLVVDVVSEWLGLSPELHLAVSLFVIALALAFIRARVEREVR